MKHSFRRLRLPLAVVVLFVCCSTVDFGQDAATALTPEQVEALAAKIDRRLMAPCCNVNTLDEHDSGLSREMRTEIRQWLREGKSEDEILAVFVERHGDSVLAMPDARGIALLGYLAPLWMAAVGIALMGFFLWRWQRRIAAGGGELAAAGASKGVAAPFIPGAAEGSEADGDAEYERRIQAQLDELDR